MSKKTSRGAVSKSSAIPSPAVSSIPQTAQKSSISKSSFAPSRLQLALFASVIQSFESQSLRIHDTNTGRLRCQHAAGPGARITSLDWGYYRTTYREAQQQNAKKKRKRGQDDVESAVVAYGTSHSEICMLSPVEGKVVGRLTGGHKHGIKDFRFSTGQNSEAWSIGGDGKLVQWDLNTDQAKRTISLPDPALNVLASPVQTHPQLLCASSTPFSVDLQSPHDQRIASFDSFKNPVHTLFRSGTDQTDTPETFLAANSDRYINIYDIAQEKLLRTLIAGSEVESVDFFTPTESSKDMLSQQLLAVVTKDGAVELFFQPFAQPKQVNGDLKSKRKNLTRKASATVRLTSPELKSAASPVFNASLQGPDLVVATTNGGIDVAFQKIRWQDEGTGELLFDGVRSVVSARSAATLDAATTNGAKDTSRVHVDESRTVVVDADAEGSSQVAAISISSSEDEDEDEVDGDGDGDGDEEDDDQDDEETSSVILPGNAQQQLGHVNHESDEDSDVDMQDASEQTVLEADDEMQVTEDREGSAEDEPTFGDLVAARDQGMISIADGLAADSSNLIERDGHKPLAVPSGISLGTVLTQSLRTNDQNLLESCLHTTDDDIIKSTIQRLDSSLAGILIQKLAERLSSRPGRYGHLMIWVQWTCVAHGGAIAGRPDIAAKIRTLYKVLTQRAKSLDNLLLLKGKLDMLDAQLAFRRQLQTQRPRRGPQDEADVIYIEGHDNWSSDEDETVGVAPSSRKGKDKPPRRDLDDLIGEFESDDDEELPTTNGILLHAGSDDEDLESDTQHEQRPGGLVDDEAEESDEELASDDDEEGDSLEEEEMTDDEEDEEHSDLDSFINDGEISEVEEEEDVDIANDDTPEKPALKKAKRA